MATSVVNPRAQFFANNGRPLIGGRIHTYVAGSSTRARTYKDAAKAQPNTNPIVLDGRGEAQIYLAEGVEYKFVVEDGKGALIYTQEPVYGAIWPNAADWPSDATLAFKYAMQSEAARDEAYAAVESIGVVHFFDKYADYAGGISAGEIVEIENDETRNNFRTRYKIQIDGSLQYLVTLPSQSSIRHAILSYPDYAAASAAAATLPDGQAVDALDEKKRYKVQAGALVFVVNLDQLRLDLAEPTGSAQAGYLPAGTGAIPTTVQGKLRERITPADKGAIGDGATNDTAKFSLLETDFPGREVDLLGKTYRVDKQPTGCVYKNGSFKLASGAVFPANRDSGQSNRGAEITLKANSDDSRYSVPSGLMGSIVVLGDSISHGAFVGNSYQDGWVNILKRMLNAETGGRGYGFTPLLSLGSGATLTQEVHDVSISGAWEAKESSTGGGDVLHGLSYTSSTAGDTITISCPTFQQSVRIWYIEDVGAGTFSYAVNGGAAYNIVTAAAARNTVKSKLIPMNDNGAGAFSVVLTVVSGSVTLTGIGYETSPNTGAELAGNVVQNFSQSGRRLRYATEDMVDLACRGSVLILALGYNDSGDVETDQAYNTAYQQVIDWVIKYCLKYNTTLVVPDFCWWSTPANKARQGLKRAATESRGIYIPLPDYLTRDQLLKNEFSDTFYLVDTLKKWSDGAHPNRNGAKWIAETVAKAMGLSCTSKEQALAFHDYPWPLQFDAASLLKNSNSQMPYVSYVKRVGDSLVYSLRAVTKTGFLGSGSEYVVNKTLSAVNSRQYQVLNTTGIAAQPVVAIAESGATLSSFSVGLAGDIRIRSFNNFVDGLTHSFTMPLDVTASTA